MWVHTNVYILTVEEDCIILPLSANPDIICRKEWSEDEGIKAMRIGKIPIIHANLNNPESRPISINLSTSIITKQAQSYTMTYRDFIYI